MYMMSEYMYSILRASTRWVTKAYTVHVNCSGRSPQYKSGRCECINIEVLSTEQGSKIVYSTCFMPHHTNVSGTYSFWLARLSVCASHFWIIGKFCKHYSSKTMRRSILISTYLVPHILKLCTSLSVGPCFGSKFTSELIQFCRHLLIWTKSSGLQGTRF